VWERDEVLRPSIKLELPAFADHIASESNGKNFVRSPNVHREHQFGSKKFEFAPQPGRTFLDFALIRNAIATPRTLSREAAADRGKVDLAAHGFFVPIKGRLKPAKERLTRCPSEWTTKDGLFVPRSLANQEDAAGHRASNHHWSLHAWASAAVRQRSEVRA
jgi:hypothetical protein